MILNSISDTDVKFKKKAISWLIATRLLGHVVGIVSILYLPKLITGLARKNETTTIWQDISKTMSLEEMKLPDKLKKLTNSLTNIISNPQKFEDAGGKLSGNVILLYGAPGTGKTTFAKAIAKKFNGEFASFDATSIRTCLVGESERNLKKMTEEVIKKAKGNTQKKIFVLFDEIDSLCKKDPDGKNYNNNLLAAVKQCLVDLGQQKNIHIIGTTNFDPRICQGPDKLDSAILSRIGEWIEVPLPTKEPHNLIRSATP